MDQDLRLLLDETLVLWGTDSWGRYQEPPLCAVAISAAGHHVTIWPGLARGLPARLRQLLGAAGQAVPAPGLRPLLAPAVSLLEAAGITAAVLGGPSFLAEPPLAPPAGGTVMCSGSPADVRRVTGCRRPPSWDAGEWAALLGGQLGPWATLVDGDQVLSICHSSRDSPLGAEAGVWTSPVFRGHGYAGVTTAAWATLMRQRDDRPLFYSTADANFSSQRVAARLGLANIGWIWTLRAA